MSEEVSAAMAQMAPAVDPGDTTTELQGDEGTEISAREKIVPHAASKAAPAPKVEPKAPEFHEVKVNGQMRKFTIEQLKAKAGIADASSERFEKASQIEKKFQAHQEKMKTDFMSALLDPELGLTKDQIRGRFESWYKEQFIDPETLTPEQRELNELKKYKSETETQRKAQAEKQAQDEERSAVDATREEMQREIIQTLETSGLPKNRFTVGRLAYWQRQNIANGYDAPADVLVQQVKEERAGIIKNDLEGASIEQIQDVLGDKFEEFIGKVRKYDLARLNKRFNGEEEVQKVKKDPNKRVMMSDVDRYFTNLRRT